MTLYTYEALIVKIHDADTVVAHVDLGFDTWRDNAHFRIAGISARELSQPGGHEARDHLAGLLPVGALVTVRSLKTGRDPAADMSFNRYVALVTLPDGRDLGELLVSTGWATPWNGKTKPTPYPAWPIPIVTA